MNTLTRINKVTAQLDLSDGRTFEVYGDNWKELHLEGLDLAAHLGITIDTVDSEMPEA